jgi:hypothetical protein
MPIWRNLSVHIKLLWNQPSRIGRWATLIGYPSMFFRQQVVCWPFDTFILYLYIKSYDKLSAKTIHLFVVIDYATWPDIGIILSYTQECKHHSNCNSHLQVIVATIPRSR